MRNKKWVRLLAYVTGSVNQELLLQNEYLAAENRILRAKRPSRFIGAAVETDRRVIETLGSRALTACFGVAFSTMALTPGRLATEEDAPIPAPPERHASRQKSRRWRWLRADIAHRWRASRPWYTATAIAAASLYVSSGSRTVDSLHLRQPPMNLCLIRLDPFVDGRMHL